MQRFPKANRLLKKTEFKRTLDNGKKIVSKHLVVFAVKGESDAMRLGLIVSKKVGGAVIRNKVKRRLRECFRTLSPELKKNALDLVIIARHSAAEAHYFDLESAFHDSLKRILANKTPKD